MKTKSLIVKYYKNNDLYTAQILNSEQEHAVAIGQNIKLGQGFFGADFVFDHDKEEWSLSVNSRKRVLSLNKKIKISDEVSMLIEERPDFAIVPQNLDKGTIKKIQVRVEDAKGGYLFSDVLPYKNKQNFKFANTKIKIKSSDVDAESWAKVYSSPKDYSVFVKIIEVPSDEAQRKIAAFNPEEKDLIKKIAIGYGGVIALMLLASLTGKIIGKYFGDSKKFDVVKIDEQFLEEKREQLFKKEPKLEEIKSEPIKEEKKIKNAYEKSDKPEAGDSKKAITKDTNVPNRGGGKAGSKLSIQGVKSNKMKITQGGKPGEYGHYGQDDATSSKLSRLSKLSKLGSGTAISGGIGYNPNSKEKATNLYATGGGGSFSSLRRGTPHGLKKGGSGFGGQGGGTHGIGSYKVGELGTLSLGGNLRGGGTGASLSKNKTSKGYVDGLDEEIVIAGGLDRSVIERVIRRNLGDINYCYERRLNARPNLSGVFEAQFSIGANGKVQSVQAARDTITDSVLDACIKSSIKTWQFPKPVGGTVVNVNYPFILKST